MAARSNQNKRVALGISKSRALWVLKIYEMGNFTLALQTLKNGIDTTTFLSTTAAAVLSLIITLAYSQKNWTRILGIKFASAISLLSCSAFCFFQSSMYLAQLGFLFPVGSDPRNPTLTKKNVAFVMILAQRFTALGLQLFYLSVPIIIWITIGPLAMSITALILLCALNFFFIDRKLPPNPELMSQIGLDEEIFV